MAKQEKKLTKWFLAQQLPQRVGMYEREWPDYMKLSEIDKRDYWDGSKWCITVGGNEFSATIRLDNNKRWRGLARRPR